MVRGEAEPSETNAVDYIVNSAKEKVTRLEKYIEELSMADEVDDLALDALTEGSEQLPEAALEALLFHEQVGVVGGVDGNVGGKGFQDEIERVAGNVGGGALSES